MHIDVIREASDGLSRRVWRFWLFAEYGLTAQLRPNLYSEEARATKRHKFRVMRAWSSHSWDRHASFTRIEWPGAPDDVREEALKTLLASIVFSGPK